MLGFRYFSILGFPFNVLTNYNFFTRQTLRLILDKFNLDFPFQRYKTVSSPLRNDPSYRKSILALLDKSIFFAKSMLEHGLKCFMAENSTPTLPSNSEILTADAEVAVESAIAEGVTAVEEEKEGCVEREIPEAQVTVEGTMIGERCVNAEATLQEIPLAAGNTTEEELAAENVPEPDMVRSLRIGDSYCCMLDNADDTDESEDDESGIIISLEKPQFKTPRYAYISHLNSQRDGYFMMFEERFSQGKYRGRNGSNACAFICIIFAKYFLKNRYVLGNSIFDENTHNSFIEGGIVSGIEQDNRLYDYYRRSLPHRYCSIAEVADCLKFVCPFALREEKPVSLKNEHYPSTLKSQLELLISFEQRFAVMFTCNEKTSVFCSDGKSVAFLDTHAHAFMGKSGGAVIIATEKDLDSLIQMVALINRIPDNMYGNLTFIRFK